MPRKKSETSAAMIWQEADPTVVGGAVAQILSQGGAAMFGQTRDNAKLIVTVYLDGDQEKEYCEDAKELEAFLGAYRV